MNTPTHFLMTAGLRKALPKIPMIKSAVLLGSVAPDVPLYVMSFGAFFYFQTVLEWSGRETVRHVFGTLYFHDPCWIGFQSLLHSPVSLLLGLLFAKFISHARPRFAGWMRWFLLACLLHSAVDILTHHDDGSVLFWPLDWHVRFYSPISYWDHAHFGSETAVFELALNAALAAYLVIPYIRKRFCGP